MSAQAAQVISVVIPDPQYDSSPRPSIVNESQGFRYQASDAIRTLSANNPNQWDIIQGLLYVPDVSDSACSNETLRIIPSNVTRINDLPGTTRLPPLAIAPWTDPECVQAFLSVMRANAVSGAIFFQPDGGNGRPPSVNDPTWSLNDGGRWQGDNQFPIYALPGSTGAFILQQLALYSGNMSTAPFGQELMEEYNEHDRVRLVARVDVSGSPGSHPFGSSLSSCSPFSLPSCSPPPSSCISFSAANVAGSPTASPAVKSISKPWVSNVSTSHNPSSRRCPPIPTPPTNLNHPPHSPRQIPMTQRTPSHPHRPNPRRPLLPTHLPHLPRRLCSLRDSRPRTPLWPHLPPGMHRPFPPRQLLALPHVQKSSLPPGYCPVAVTNIMVRRERLVRRMRARASGEDMLVRQIDAEAGHGMIPYTVRRIRNRVAGRRAASAGLHSSRALGGAANAGAAEMSNINAVNPPAPAATAPVGGEVSREPRVTPAVNPEEVPAEVAAQGTSARRAWLRERFATREQRVYEEGAAQARAVDEERPRWRRILGKVFPSV